MKTLKMLLLVTITAMTVLYCKAVESYNCDGMAEANCHPDSTSCDGQDCIWEGDGNNDVLNCTSSSEDQGNCSWTGTVSCSYPFTEWVESTGTVYDSGTYDDSASTYTCN